MELKPLHVGISVNDIDSSIKWYNEILGFKTIFLKEIPMLSSKVAFLKNSDFEIELFEHSETQSMPEGRRMPNEDIKVQGTKHICFSVLDIDEAFEFFREQNVDVVFGPALMEGEKMGFIRDPSGVLIEFIQR